MIVRKIFVKSLVVVVGIVCAVFILPMVSVNDIELIVNDVLYVPVDLERGLMENEIVFIIINNGFLPVTIKDLKITSYIGETELGTEIFYGIITIDSNSYINESIKIYEDLSKLHAENDYETTWQKIQEKYVIEARALCLLYKTRLKIIYVIPPSCARDTDCDFLSDRLEVYGFDSNPLKIDSDGGGVDDYNEVYTWCLDPRDPDDDEEFLEKIPDVKARHWELEDGGLGYFSLDKYIKISMRDPFIQWLTKRAEIRWETIDEDKKMGKIYVNEEEIWKVYESDDPTIDQPSYYFTHGRKGSCGTSSLINYVILRSMDLKVLKISGRVSYKNKPTAHGWIEAYIDGEVYVVDYNDVFPREGFYQKRGWVIDEDINYDPNWYKNGES